MDGEFPRTQRRWRCDTQGLMHSVPCDSQDFQVVQVPITSVGMRVDRRQSVPLQRCDGAPNLGYVVLQKG